VTRREPKPSTREVSEAGQRKIAAAELDRLIEEATVDCHDESEQVAGFYTMLEDNLTLPFETQVLGVKVTVESLDLTDGEEIVAVCRRGQARQVIPIHHLPLPTSPVRGAEWIEAFRRWARGRS
jgi:Calcium binding